jgi:pyridoxal phosphate phosphatase PHOSPHO2
MKILFAFDFDNTIIDDDSDHFIVKELSEPLFKRLNTAKGQWTDVCNEMVGELYKLGFKPSDLNTTLASIPFNPVMLSVLKLIKETGNDILIISDANNVYIDEISTAKGFKGLIDDVITNPAIYLHNGRLQITRHTLADDAHKCEIGCAANLCKGRELERYLATKKYDKIVYLGDGFNDFCPSTKLRKGDAVMPRKGFRFSKMLNDKKFRSQIDADILEWQNAQDIMDLLKNNLLP